MKQQRILDMLEHVDERYILEAAPALRARRSSGPRKAGRTLLIAAVIVCLFAALCAAGLEPKRVQLVRTAPDKAPWLFLVEAQKDRRPGLRWEPDLIVRAGVTYGPGQV